MYEYEHKDAAGNYASHGGTNHMFHIEMAPLRSIKSYESALYGQIISNDKAGTDGCRLAMNDSR